MQEECLRAASGSENAVRSIASDPEASDPLRQVALQVLYWLAPDACEDFLTEAVSTGSTESIRESARALLFRLSVRHNVSEKHPERLMAYERNVRVEYAKSLYEGDA